MGNSINLRFSVLMILAGTIFSSCRQQDHNKGLQKDALFSLLRPKDSGIRFANQLQETDSSNSIFYEYYYNGSTNYGKDICFS